MICLIFIINQNIIIIKHIFGIKLYKILLGICINIYTSKIIFTE